MDEPPDSVDETARRRFEADWKAGAPAELATYLPSPGDRHYLPTLIELVSIDMEMRWRKRAVGGPPPLRVEDYIAAHSCLSHSQIVIDLVHQEATLRTRAGDSPARNEYSQRFPNLDPGSLHSGMGGDVTGFTRWPRIPDCEIVRELGRGGMGVVYLANQPSLQRQVAVKTIRYASDARPQDLARFYHEAEAVGRLQHPNIVPIHHIGRDAEMPYFLMEYVEHGTLAGALVNGPLPPNQAAELVETLARTMEYAHQRGIIHRDLKPANILLTNAATRTPKITDFGLAKSLDLDSNLTQTGNIIGTPSYMAPEQASRTSGLISTSTDVYALGAILYEALTGQPPFRGESIGATLDDVLNREPVPPSRLKPGISRDLETICLHCLQKDPVKRYARAELLADDLRRYLSHQPIRARRIGAWGVAVRWCRRNPSLATTLTASVVIVAAVAGLGIWNVLKERDKFRTERDKAQSNLYRSLTAQASGHLDSRGSEWWWKATGSLAEASRLETPERDVETLRDLYVRCLGTPYQSLRVKETWTSRVGTPLLVAIAGNGKHCAVAGFNGTLEVRDLPDGGNPRLFPGHANVSDIAFHPIRSVLYSCSQDGIVRTINLQTDTSSEWQAKTATELTTLACSPSGDKLLAGTGSGAVLAFPLDANGQPGEPASHPGGKGAITSLTYSPRGHEYVTADRAKALTGHDPADGRELWATRTINYAQRVRYDTLSEAIGFVDPLDFGFSIIYPERGLPHIFPQLHDNAVRRVFLVRRGGLTASIDGSLRVWGREAGRPLTLWSNSQADFGPIVDAELTPDGSNVFVAYRDGTLRLWELFEPATRSVFNSHSQSVSFVGASHSIFDGHRLLDLDTQATKVFSIAVSATPAIWGTASSADGKWLAAGSHDGRVIVREAATGTVAARFSQADSLVWSVAFHPGHPWVAGGYGKIAIWDYERKDLLMELDGHAALTTSLAFHPTLPLLVSAGRDRYLRIWDLEEKKLLAVHGPLDTFANSLAFDAEGTWLAAACEDTQVRLWKMTGLEEAKAFASPPRVLTGHTSPVKAVAFSREGLLASGAEQGVVLLRDSKQDFRKLVRLQSGTGQIRSLQFSADSRYLACGYYISTAVAWDLPAVRKALAEVGLDW